MEPGLVVGPELVVGPAWSQSWLWGRAGCGAS